jgi:hypothetical protein
VLSVSSVVEKCFLFQPQRAQRAQRLFFFINRPHGLYPTQNLLLPPQESPELPLFFLFSVLSVSSVVEKCFLFQPQRTQRTQRLFFFNNRPHSLSPTQNLLLPPQESPELPLFTLFSVLSVSSVVKY